MSVLTDPLRHSSSNFGLETIRGRPDCLTVRPKRPEAAYMGLFQQRNMNHHTDLSVRPVCKGVVSLSVSRLEWRVMRWISEEDLVAEMGRLQTGPKGRRDGRATTCRCEARKNGRIYAWSPSPRSRRRVVLLRFCLEKWSCIILMTYSRCVMPASNAATLMRRTRSRGTRLICIEFTSSGFTELHCSSAVERQIREHCKVWGNYAAILSFPPDFILGYHCSNLDRSVPSRVRARV